MSVPLVAGLALAPSTSVQATGSVENTDPLAVSQDGVAADSRDQVLGSDWRDSPDVAHVVLGDSSGLTVLRAAKGEGYAWGGLANLPTNSSVDTDLWISNSCITSSRNYMVVVYGPRAITNDENEYAGAGHAAIVNLKDGSVTDLGVGYTIAYFNPGCGDGDSVAITRYESDYKTTLVAALNASTGEILAKYELAGEVTSAISRSTGSILAVGEGGIIAVDNGKKPTVAVPSAQLAYDLALDEKGRLAFVSLGTDGTQASVSVLNPGEGSKPTKVATGPVTEIGVRSAVQGGFFILGADVKPQSPDTPGVRYIPTASTGSTLSSNGELVIDGVLPPGVARAASADDPSIALTRISGAAVETKAKLEFQLAAIRPAPGITTYPSLSGGGYSVALSSDSIPAIMTAIAMAPGLVPMGDPHDPSDTERSCAVVRNDPSNQAYQPKPRQVEWAVDRAVKGQLTQTRPTNWRGLGLSTTAPQTDFPRVTLVGGGTIPPQIVLGVLMQESNIWQADRYTSPGNTGNPLVGDYYANRDSSSIWDIDFSSADCGYGVGQITDGMRASDTSLTTNQQRAIALDYKANVAMTVRMLGQKWNEIANAGFQVNNGNANRIENWFFAIWSYNTGLHPYVNSSTPWGVGWFNNPVNPIYPAGRAQFLEVTQADAIHPQDWPYSEKVIGWAAFGTALPETVWTDASTRTYETHFVSSYTTASWPTELDRTDAKPPRTKFCSLPVNDCDPTSSSPCTLSSDECWWHANATYRNSCNTYCGQGNERFDSTYNTEASSMSSSLPAITLQSSFPADCSAPPSGVVVVDDTTQVNARNSGECTNQSTTGSFSYTFTTADSNGSYPAKVDLHQQGGGFNGHFSFAHMQASSTMTDYPGAQATVIGTWNRGADMTDKWTRVWVHLPDYAAWTQQAAYTIYLGDGSSETRYLPQRRYANQWVSLGVFQMKGTPSVALSNVLTDDYGSAILSGMHLGDDDNLQDVAWDAVGFQELSAKPADFVVSLGDSFSSGEGAGGFDAWSDNNGGSLESRNACHQSSNAWIRKTVLPSHISSIGSLESSADPSLDFHFLACSGAETENLMPFQAASGTPPVNAESQGGDNVQWSQVSQLDAGYLDGNTTLVTLSIGGNDMRFAQIVVACIEAQITSAGDCSGTVLPGDVSDVITESADRIANEIPASIATLLSEIRERAPNAQIALVGYPKLFESGSACVGIAEDNMDWLNDVSDALDDALAAAAAAANAPGEPDVYFVDPRSEFSGSNLCTGEGISAINGLVPSLTPGEGAYFQIDGLRFWGTTSPVSQQSVHPNELGTDLYANAVEAELALH